MRKIEKTLKNTKGWGEVQRRGEGKEKIESERCQARKDIMAKGIFTSSQIYSQIKLRAKSCLGLTEKIKIRQDGG